MHPLLGEVLGTLGTYFALSFGLRFLNRFHVLRTYRRAAGEKRKAEVNAKARALHFEEHYVTKYEV